MTDSGPRFKIETQKAEGSVIFEVTGDLDLLTLPQLNEVVEALGDFSGEILLNLADTTFVDSIAVNAILRLDKRFKAGDQIKLVVIVPESNKTVWTVFDLMGVKARLDIRTQLP